METCNHKKILGCSSVSVFEGKKICINKESPSAFQRKICILTNSEGKNLTCLGKKSVHTDMAGLKYVDRYQWEEKCKLMEYKKL